MMEHEYHYYCSEIPGEVSKVLIKDGMYVKEGQPMYVIKTQILSRSVPKLLSDESQKSMYKKSIETLTHFPPDVFPNVDKIFEPEEQHFASSLVISADDDDVMKRYANFKTFDIVMDHSDHLFSSHTCAMKHPDWTSTIKQERRILEQHLPQTIFVRAYESRMDLLRAVIIGPEGTPYHHGLFFFDVFFPNKYPYIPPLVRYHSIGLCISPNMNMCGEVCFSLLDTDAGEETLWVPGTTMLQLLVSIQDLIFNTKPYFNGIGNAMTPREYLSLLYNENTIIKSLKTMVHTMNKPPKNFEDFVVGHFRTRVGDIKMACKAYMEGLQLGCLVSDVTCSIEFKNDVASCIKSLVDGFDKIGAKGAQEFLSLVKKRSVMDDEPTNYELEKKRKVVFDENRNDAVSEKRADIETGHGSGDHYVPWSWTVTAYEPSLVTKVLVKEGMKVQAQQPLFVIDAAYMMDAILQVHTPSSVRQPDSAIQKILEANQSSRAGIFSMEDPLANQDCADYKDVKITYKYFKKFDFVVDHSDHFFSAQNSDMNQLPGKRIRKEWKILKEQLPGTIYVRVYKSRIDLLRAVIVGPEGTPYHNALFFFDVCFPRNYPKTPPLVYYHSGGLGINPNLDKCGDVRLSLPKTSGGQETMWLPCTSTILQLLVSIQNQILIANPLFNEPTYAHMKGSVYGDHSSALYNENILIKSLKTMTYTILKPPKNFEGFVRGHFYSRARDILISCNRTTCSTTFKNDMDLCIKDLVGAFSKIKAKQWKVMYSQKKKNQVLITLVDKKNNRLNL
uniref:uncharacterized protein LOC122610445 n=1 Tax=Erigeron canadensis TaxID=72917 RepID=UPI001CB8A78D|nr:uncharacterized protein LOC122610445 [Erigeron canadensis]